MYVYVCMGVWFGTVACLLHPCKLPTHFIKPISHRLGKKKKKKKDFKYINFKGQFHITMKN